MENSNRIKELDSLLPDVAKEQFYKEQLYQSIISTDDIEGIKTTRREAADALKSLEDARKEKVRLASTLRLYNDIRKDDFLAIDKLEVIRHIYDELTDGEIDQEDQLDGKLFRNSSVSVVDSAKQKIEHIAPISEQQIVTMLQSWISFINDDQYPVLIKAFLAHYFFENIHPFYDGNGRTGRYLLSRHLARKLDIYSGLALSQQINQDKKKYYQAFKITGDADNKAEGTFFVQALMEILRDGQESIILTLEEKRSILEEYSEELAQSDYTDLERSILFLLYQSQVFVDDPADHLSDNDIIAILACDNPKLAIKRTIDQIEKEGIIKLTTQRPKRHILV